MAKARAGRGRAEFTASEPARRRTGRPVRKRGAARPARAVRANPHSGSSVEGLLREEGLYEDAAAVAIKRVVVWQLEQAMEARGLSKSQLARQMGTSRAALQRLLDPENDSVTLRTLARAASVLDAELQVTLSRE